VAIALSLRGIDEEQESWLPLSRSLPLDFVYGGILIDSFAIPRTVSGFFADVRFSAGQALFYPQSAPAVSFLNEESELASHP